MVKHLMVAFDGSDESRRALRWALGLAKQTSAKVDVVAVVRPPEIGADVETEAWIDRSRAHYKHLLAELPDDTSVKLRTHILVGHPAEQLLRYAEGHGVDHIVVGQRSRSVVSRWWMGSVSRQVRDHATCSVTTVR